MADRDVLQGYAADAAELVPRFEAISTEEVLAPVREWLPADPCHVLEIGAGTGRDAAWLAGKGHRVVAAEPVAALRRAGMALHAAANIDWVDDRLPGLAQLRRRSGRYDLVLVVAVWQHLRPDQHEESVAALAALVAPGGRLILSLRHGTGSPARPCFPASPEAIIGWAEGEGLRLVLRREAESVQQANRDAGVTWTWLCLERN